jgi:hypothetical protein
MYCNWLLAPDADLYAFYLHKTKHPPLICGGCFVSLEEDSNLVAQLSAFVLRYEPGVTAGFGLTKMAGFGLTKMAGFAGLTGFVGTVALAAALAASKAALAAAF